ncbi:MAG TPA: aminotransferase class III-fold pyridoxal phosphate-dependent enzyme, partial [Myxococcota bacterium]|nr:aminotransferase class III-fold pyridoxal phosphate-dependent enzyme [Myxococcota bacterium]
MKSVTAADAHKVLDTWLVGDAMEVVCDLSRSEGQYLHDAKTGKKFLDFFCFFAARPVGFNHPKLKDAAFLERLQAAALHKPSNCDLYTVDYASFVDAFGSVACGNAFPHLFFIEGGSPAVENAVKAAIDWKHRKNLAAGRGEKGSQILHFKQAFHGRTGYCLSLTDSFDVRKTQYFPKFLWPRVTNPKMAFPQDGAGKEETQKREA